MRVCMVVVVVVVELVMWKNVWVGRGWVVRWGGVGWGPEDGCLQGREHTSNAAQQAAESADAWRSGGRPWQEVPPIVALTITL